MKILIADDSDFVRASLTKMLSSVKYISKIFQADKVSSAIEIINNYNPDLLILDISFPESNGFEILKAGRKNSSVKIIIMLTNYPSNLMRNKSFAYGADHFFDKSNEFEKVIDVINEFVNCYNSENKSN